MKMPCKSVILCCVLGVLAGCSHDAATGPAGRASTAASQPGSSSSGISPSPANAGNACDRKLLTAADLAGILDEPITGTEPLKGDPQTCYFITATSETQGGPKIMISLRPGLGKATLDTFTSGKMAAYAKSTPMAGVGDEAVWLPDTYEVNARKNDLLCGTSIRGSAVIGNKPADLQARLGALCNKIFAAP